MLTSGWRCATTRPTSTTTRTTRLRVGSASTQLPCTAAPTVATHLSKSGPARRLSPRCPVDELRVHYLDDMGVRRDVRKDRATAEAAEVPGYLSFFKGNCTSYVAWRINEVEYGGGADLHELLRSPEGDLGAPLGACPSMEWRR